MAQLYEAFEGPDARDQPAQAVTGSDGVKDGVMNFCGMDVGHEAI